MQYTHQILDCTPLSNLVTLVCKRRNEEGDSDKFCASKESWAGKKLNTIEVLNKKAGRKRRTQLRAWELWQFTSTTDHFSSWIIDSYHNKLSGPAIFTLTVSSLWASQTMESGSCSLPFLWLMQRKSSSKLWPGWHPNYPFLLPSINCLLILLFLHFS